VGVLEFRRRLSAKTPNQTSNSKTNAKQKKWFRTLINLLLSFKIMIEIKNRREMRVNGLQEKNNSGDKKRKVIIDKKW
jgi:hypothetical protein